jgi:Tfp pilus assembly protein PilF
MAEKLTRKEKIALQKKSPGFSPKQIEKQEKGNRSLKRILGLLVAIIGFVLYSNTFGNGYVLDDNGLIVENTQTRQGIKAIPEIFKTSYRYGMNLTDFSLYRPLSKAMFAAEWQLSGGDPALSHWVNVLLYALLCFMIFVTLSRYLKGDLFVPFVAALLFTAHPIHTEVVANIKSRDEILCLLLCISAVYVFHSYATRHSKRALVTGTGIFFLALFSKESSITFLLVIPLMYYFFTGAEKGKYINTLLTTGAVTVVFLILRRNILGNTETLIPMEDNSLVAIKNIIVQRANAISILGVYLKLFVFPSPLMADASYNHFPAVSLMSWKFLLPFVILAGAGVYALMRFRKKDIVSFCILYFFITASLVSNVFILIGTNYGERLMFLPSLGVCLLFAVLLSRLFKTAQVQKVYTNVSEFFSGYSRPIGLVLVVVVLFGVKTMARNTDWKDDFTLYSTDVKKVPDSAHLLFYIANHITSDEYLATLPDSAARMQSRQEGIDYLTRALTIHPKYADGYQRRGFIYNQIKKPELAEQDYREALVHNPTHPIVYNNYGTLCFDQRRYDEAMYYFQKAILYNPRYAHALNNLASTYGVFGQGEAEMIGKDPEHSEQHANRSKENFEKAIVYFKKSIEADPEFGEPYRLAAITYRNLGNAAEGERYERLYKQVQAAANSKTNAKN